MPSMRAMPTVTRVVYARRPSGRTGALVTCSRCVQAKERRASAPAMTLSRRELPLQRVLVDRTGPRKLASAGGSSMPGPVHGRHDAHEMALQYSLRSKSTADVAAATQKFLTDVGRVVECFRTETAPSFLVRSSRLYSETKSRHECTRVDGHKNNGVVERGLGLIPECGTLRPSGCSTGRSQTLAATGWKRPST